MVANIIGPELLVVLAIVGLLFGGSRLPHLARSVGAARGEFERGLHDVPGDHADAPVGAASEAETEAGR